MADESMFDTAPNLGFIGILADVEETEDMVTHTQYVIYESDREAKEAALDWLRFHGIDPNWVPRGTVIYRHANICSILYFRYVEGTDRKVKIENVDGVPQAAQEPTWERGEAPPLPFPDACTKTIFNQFSFQKTNTGTLREVLPDER